MKMDGSKPHEMSVRSLSRLKVRVEKIWDTSMTLWVGFQLGGVQVLLFGIWKWSVKISMFLARERKLRIWSGTGSGYVELGFSGPTQKRMFRLCSWEKCWCRGVFGETSCFGGVWFWFQ